MAKSNLLNQLPENDETGSAADEHAQPLDDAYAFQQAQEQFESKRRYEPRAKSSAQVLSKLIARRGFTQTKWNEQLHSTWLSVIGQTSIGKTLSGKTRATIVKRGVLEVLVESSAAMQQLAFTKNQLLQKIQIQLPEAKIKALRFKVGPVNF